jgi:hypothetical protein
MKKGTLLFLLSLLLLQCGYHLRGTGSSLPPHIKVISVPMFANRTTRFELDLKLTQGVIDEMISRGKVEITDELESADAVLIGEILRFHANPIGFGEDATADRYNISIVAKVILRDLVQKKVIFSNASFVYQGEYDVPEGMDFESLETEAIDEMAVKFARSLVVSILEGF